MTDIKRVGDAGVYTQEGNLAGARAARLNKQREKDKASYEATKNKIKEANASVVGRIDDKFNTSSDALEQEFRRQTVGLVSAEQFRKAKDVIDLAKTEHEKRQLAEKASKEAEKKTERENKRKAMASSLSFAEEDNLEEEDEKIFVPKRLTKNPDAETDFLPDRNRDEELQRQRELITAEWLEEQKVIKQELLEVTYSFWDGSGHRKVIRVTKGTTIGKFLMEVKSQLDPEFPELRKTSADRLMYVKGELYFHIFSYDLSVPNYRFISYMHVTEDLIIPHNYSFYDLIVTKARGKSGPLFHFDVHEDIRLRHDATIEKDESHPGKVLERHWYERNKHIFPASRCGLFSPPGF